MSLDEPKERYDKMNRAICLNYVDEDNRDSYKLCLGAYDIKCLRAEDVDENTVEIVIYGPAANVDAFKKAYDEGELEPLESMSRDLEFDEDYEGWLNNEVYWFDQLSEIEDKT